MAEMSKISQAWSGILASFKIYGHVLYVMDASPTRLSLNLYKIIFQLTQCLKMLNMFCISKKKKKVCVTGGKETHISF